MAIIRKKIWPETFDDVQSGKKRFEVRLADFEVQPGDTLVLKEWDPKTKGYTGRKTEKKVTYVFTFNLDRYGQREEIEEKGIRIIQF